VGSRLAEWLQLAGCCRAVWLEPDWLGECGFGFFKLTEKHSFQFQQT
jgi:hypothetical protein